MNDNKDLSSVQKRQMIPSKSVENTQIEESVNKGNIVEDHSNISDPISPKKISNNKALEKGTIKCMDAMENDEVSVNTTNTANSSNKSPVCSKVHQLRLKGNSLLRTQL